MNTSPSILVDLHSVLRDALLELNGGERPVINFYTLGGVRLATIAYDDLDVAGVDGYLIFMSNSSKQLFATVTTSGDAAIFRIQYPSGLPASFLFSGSVGVTGRGADFSFPDTYWPESSTIVINNLRMYVNAGSIN